MKSFRIFFLALYGSSPIPSQGLPEEELPGFGQASLMPASFLLRPELLPEGALARLLEDPSRARCSEFSLALWSAQQTLCEKLSHAGLDVRGLPPMSGRALEAFFLPSGRFWMGAYFPIDSLPQAQDRLSKSFALQIGNAPLATPSIPFPWLPDFGRSGGGWALAASQILGSRAEGLGLTARKNLRASSREPLREMQSGSSKIESRLDTPRIETVSGEPFSGELLKPLASNSNSTD